MICRASIIQLTIDSDIAVTCTENSVYVYDGLPDFVSATGNHQSHVLGVFCTQDTQYPVTVEAKSGKHKQNVNLNFIDYFSQSNLRMLLF